MYQRDGVYYFRRAVPSEAVASFGKRQVWVSLRTSNLAEARLALSTCLRDFDAKVLAVRGEGIVSPPARSPAPSEIDAGVRAWFADRLARARLEVARRTNTTSTLRQDLEAELYWVREAARSGEATQASRWLVETLCAQFGWDAPEGSEAYAYILRLAVRGQAEVAQQVLSEVDYDPVRIKDSAFAPDQYVADVQLKRLPSSSVDLIGLFESYAAEAQLKPATLKAWRRQIRRFVEFLGHQDANRVRPEDVVAWKEKLLSAPTDGSPKLAARTVQDTYLALIRTMFRWAVENGKVPSNPATNVKVKVRKSQALRAKSLRDDEAQLILAATLSQPPSRLSPERAAARRWVPWLCAYTGARVNEMTQLRGEDVAIIEGVWCVRITPEAGSVKSDTARVVPLHQHLIEQGFLEFAAGRAGPLFYSPSRQRGGKAANPQYKKVGEYLAKWTREIGVIDRGVAPNHGWRHRFKTEARLASIDPEVRDAIQGHVPRTEGEAYGEIPIAALERAVQALRWYPIGAKFGSQSRS